MQVEFRSHFSGKKVRLMGREIRYDIDAKLLERANLQKVKRNKGNGTVVWKPYCELSKGYEKQQTFIAMPKPEQTNPDVQCADTMKLC
jgi:hypothetical protein